MKQDNTKNRQAAEAQQLREKSAFINQVASFAEYMKKEYIEPSDGERSLIISAGDATTDNDCVLRTQCLMGQHVQVSAGLASMMSNANWQPVFRLARRMADDYDDLDDRRSKLRRDRRRLLTVIAIGTLWAVWLVTQLIINIVMHRSVLIDITCLLLMAAVAANLYPQWRDMQRERCRLRADEADHRHARIDRELAQVMHRFFSKFTRERDDDDE